MHPLAALLTRPWGPSKVGEPPIAWARSCQPIGSENFTSVRPTPAAIGTVKVDRKNGSKFY